MRQKTIKGLSDCFIKSLPSSRQALVLILDQAQLYIREKTVFASIIFFSGKAKLKLNRTISFFFALISRKKMQEIRTMYMLQRYVCNDLPKSLKTGMLTIPSFGNQLLHPG